MRAGAHDGAERSVGPSLARPATRVGHRPRPSSRWARPVLLLNRWLREALQAFQLVPVPSDPLLADRGKRDVSVGLVADEPLVDLDQPSLLQLSQVAGQV